MSKQITALEFIRQITKTVDEDILHCEKMSNKLLNEAIPEISKHCSGDFEKDLKNRIKSLSIKYDRRKETVIENKNMFLKSIGLMGLMGLTNDEKLEFIKETSLDLLSSIITAEKELFDEYVNIGADFNKIVNKSNH